MVTQWINGSIVAGSQVVRPKTTALSSVACPDLTGGLQEEAQVLSWLKLMKMQEGVAEQMARELVSVSLP